ncbi:AfsA-related hotdog domain-containing protein [Streptomyces sp. NPDC059651]|uniref:AfsA-related hotdog domain-containing protein n=1 Tax=Streptomyces sp. NPDC059651 TaxID=3346897 RepID=UPI0036B0C718
MTVVQGSDRTVPWGLVHKASVENVFITGVEATGADVYAATARLPLLNRLLNDSPDSPFDLLALTEIIRQAGEVMMHVHFGVGPDTRFIIRSVDLAREPSAPPWHGSPELRVDLRLANVRKRSDGSPRSIAGTADFWHRDRRVATFAGTTQFLDADAYDSMREGARPNSAHPSLTGSRLAPERVGRTHPQDVLVDHLSVTGEDATAELALAVDHPFFFDHEVDHYPGTALLEACRQASVALTARVLGSPPRLVRALAWKTRFTGFGEFSAPVHCSARVLARDGSTVVCMARLTQSDELIVETEVTCGGPE